jgi:hypothetical protein
MMGLVAIALALAIGVALAMRRRTGTNALPPPPAGDGLTMHGCPRCGNGIAADWAFCPFCARALTHERGAPGYGAALAASGPDSG